MKAITEHETNLTRAYELCVAKARRTIKMLADEPKSGAFDKDGHYFNFHEGFFDIGNWTSSFFTGMALMAWRHSKDGYFLEQTERLAGVYREKAFVRHDDTMHDLGFLYSLYSVALYKLNGSAEHREVGLRAAELLAGRFVENGGYIRAWGRVDELDTDYAGLAIIDCLMNLPLLFWASEETGDNRFRDIAVRHADTVLANMIRPDDTVFHSLRFDVATGTVTGEDNYCAFANGSAWARGTAWAIYGFAMIYRYTNETRFLDASLRVARRFAVELGDAGIPVWDFRLPAGENDQLDTSAASAAVCGLLELESLGVSEEMLVKCRAQMLDALTNGEYLNFDPAVEGVLDKAEVGNGVGKARYAFTSWGDYYLMEALDRVLWKGETWW